MNQHEPTLTDCFLTFNPLTERESQQKSCWPKNWQSKTVAEQLDGMKMIQKQSATHLAAKQQFLGLILDDSISNHPPPSSSWSRTSRWSSTHWKWKPKVAASVYDGHGLRCGWGRLLLVIWDYGTFKGSFIQLTRPRLEGKGGLHLALIELKAVEWQDTAWNPCNVPWKVKNSSRYASVCCVWVWFECREQIPFISRMCMWKIKSFSPREVNYSRS